MSTPQMYKKPRAFKSANEEPPAGYHYEGQPAQMIDGKLTVRLRRDVEGSRNEIYNDLYYAETELSETKKVKIVKYICCVSGCRKSVSMFVKDSGCVVFENFFKHLVKEHPEYLFENDLPARPIERPSPSFINPVETHTREVTRFFS